MGSEQIDRAAWRALKQSRRLLPDVMGGRAPIRLSFGSSSAHSSRRERIYTGYSVDSALEALRAQGHEETAARQAVARVILKQFPKFGASWSGYINGNGWLHELVRLPEDERNALAEELNVTELVAQTQEVLANPYGSLANLGLLSGLAQASARLNKEQEQPGSPIRYFLERRFGLDSELALAVLKYGMAVPWWVLLLLPLMGLLCTGLFVLAIVNPEAEAFQNAGGVNIMHFTVVPLFAIFFFGATVWLTRDRPRREREWRAQLERYRQVVESA
ncbi:hypothetical protein JW859_05045 [bacterium]|nr:hypothetical protein [bacterium]